jgi:predicted nucleic acid-binding protein
MNPPIVVDTNVLFSALVSQRSRVREILLMEAGLSFCCPRFIFGELFKHKERIVAATDLSEEELLDALNALFARIRFIDESAIPLSVPGLKRGGYAPALMKKTRRSSR